MQPTYSADTREYRAKVSAFLDENLPENWRGIGALTDVEKLEFSKGWRQVLSDNGYLAPSWPVEYGGPGLTALENIIINEEFYKRGVPTMGTNDGFSITMVGNTIIHRGTEEQRKYHLPRILDGSEVWCQGYSEPNAGSDLANLGCKAELDGDEWILNGQKIWTSAGQYANWIFVLARTAPEVAKHQGISFMLVPMDQPGVEVRPIVNMAGHSHFNEVFFSDARCPKENVIGEVNQGWSVANTLLGFERGARVTVVSLGFRDELDRLVELAKERGATSDPLIRQRLAKAHSKVEIMRYLGMQGLSSLLAGEAPGAGSSIGKLNWSSYHKEVTELALDILGSDAMVHDSDPSQGSGLGSSSPGTPNTATSWINTAYMSRSGTIYAGSSEVQRNIIGERILGLPKEPRADTGPWKDTPK
ncbi:MAG: acyl-CoA dehydrogenase [Actinomycetia bacterium]|nr:acyl-CoA dehydrogenase [Actinomycetes bacterium]MCP4961190.1 acyl-CoA dehydrogenase [Actinomycetes bacterium]